MWLQKKLNLLRTFLNPALKEIQRNFCLISPSKEPIVTVLEACCTQGRILSLLLKQNPLIGELRLYDQSDVGGIAEDLSHIDTRTQIKSFEGKSVLKYAVSGADIVVSVGGCRASYREKPAQSFEKNLDDIRNAALHLIEFNSKAIYCIAKPPVEAFVPLVSEEFKKAGVYDSRKIIGVTNIGTMRTNSIIATSTGQSAAEVLCPIVGGLSADCLVPVLSQSKPKGLTLIPRSDFKQSNEWKGFRFEQNPKGFSPLQSKTKCQMEIVIQPKALQTTIINCEDSILKLYADCGSICLTPALAVSRFINVLLKALKGETNCVDCAFIRQTGHIGQFLPYMTSIVRLGRQGVMSSHMPKLSGEEAYWLKKASIAVKQLIQMGEGFVTGKLEPSERNILTKIPFEQQNKSPSIRAES